MNLTATDYFIAGALMGIGLSKLYSVLCEKYKNFHNDCFFFTPRNVDCGDHCLSRTHDRSNGGDLVKSPYPCNQCNLKSLTSLLSKTKKQLDICLYLITSEEICLAIVKLIHKGVNVRLIMDHHMSQTSFGDKLSFFQKVKLPVKIIRSDFMMHNKFAIIDHKVVITGSSNWTRQAFTGNFENVIVLSNKEIAKKYMEYFELLWKVYWW